LLFFATAAMRSHEILVTSFLSKAQSDHTAPPSVSSTPNLGCQARTGGLAVPAQGETTGSANFSDELSRSKGVICPPAEVDPGISAPLTGGGVPGTPGGDPRIIPK
jgi:hypothetical protein